MAKIDKEELRVNLKSLDIKKQNLERLKEIFPAAFSEGKVDFKKLEQLLGEDVEKGIERYNFTWPGKSNAIKEISAPSLGTLKPVRDESVNFDDTENLFIEADNLEALKLLQKSYLGKIKMIYIDPPYNTGKDFVYKDNFGETLKDYLEFTQQKDEDGKVFTTNPDSAGRFHSNWLNMIYPRLYLARNLLTDDGLIFVSIDDNEFINLKRVCDEIFGEANFVDTIVWKKRYQGAKEKYHAAIHEYILIYAKNKINLPEFFITMTDEFIGKYFRLKDEKVLQRGPYRTQPLEAGASMDARPNLIYPITGPNGQEIMPKKQWIWDKTRTYEALKNNELDFTKNGDGWSVRFKQYLKDENGEMRRTKPFSIIDFCFTQDGTKEINALIGDNVFNFPKPSKLIKHLLDMATHETKEKSDIILDFFAGSSSTAQAVLDLNQVDGGNRRFIMVQLPEQTSKKSEAYQAGYQSIADIAKERIRRVIANIKKASDGKLELDKKKQDLGFKVFKLDKSSFKAWDGTDPDNLDAQLQLGVDRVDARSTDEDILYEIMLKDGFMLTEKPEIKTIDGKKVYSFGDGFLLVCLEKNLNKEFIKQMAELMPKTESDATVIFLDEGFHDNDQLLVNAVEIFKSRNEKINFRIV